MAKSYNLKVVEASGVTCKIHITHLFPLLPYSMMFPLFSLPNFVFLVVSFFFCKWYEWWEKSGFFVTDPEIKKPPL